MRQVIEEQTEGYTHHQRRCEPAVEDEINEAELDPGQHDAQKDAAGDAPLNQFIPTPESAIEEEILVIEEARGDQPERPEGADDVIGIVLRVVHMGVVLQMHPREHREAEAKQQCRTMAHHGVPEAAGMGGVVAGVVNDGAFQMERQKAGGQQQRQGPPPEEPTGDRDQCQGVTTQEQAHGGIPGRRRVEILLGNGTHRGPKLLAFACGVHRLNQSLHHPLGSASEPLTHHLRN